MTPSIIAVGINHLTAPVELRELFACKPNKEGVLEELSYLSNLPYVEEIVLLSTCNRVEIYAVLNKEEKYKDLIKEFIKLKLGKVEDEYLDLFFVKKGLPAIEHIFSVPAGLASMVLGENQIVSQFKEAFKIAKKQGTVGKILNRLYQFALKAAKRVRSETEISKTPVSVSYIAVLLAKKVFGDLENKKVLVVGAGEMAELTALYLKEEKAKIFITNRTLSKALELAKKMDANVIKWEDFKSFLSEVDIAIFSTSAENYIFTKRDAEKIFLKKDTPTVLIDISVPRNVEPSIRKFTNVFLFNIDDLRKIVQKNLQTRKKEAQKGLLIVKEEAQKFLKELENLFIGNLIRELKETVDLLAELSCKEDPQRSLELFKNRILSGLFSTVKENPSVGSEILRNLQKVLKDLKERI